MEEALLQEIATRYLLPFFSGAELESQPVQPFGRHSKVAFRDPQSLAFRVADDDPYRLVLTRSQPFVTRSGGAAVPEIEVVRAFVSVVGSMASEVATHLKDDLLSTFQRKVVARAMGSIAERETTILAGIDQLDAWSKRSYEGAPISAAIGFRHTPQSSSSPRLSQLGKDDYSALLGNGHDTLLEFDFAGRLKSHRSLTAERPPSYCPLRQAPIAEWTAKDRRGRRVAMCLNREREILVFRDKELLFARRAGSWNYLTHEPVLTQMGTPHDMRVRKSVYETCLDASFARTGACIGIVSSSSGAKWRKVVDKDDRLESSHSMKTRVMNSLISGRLFQRLNRRLRQELVAIDGATVIGYHGEVLAVGAILKIPGGSTGGGRRAAAETLGELGLGVKVSQDGGIIGFRGKPAKTAFRVM